jgi:hypothetical protein
MGFTESGGVMLIGGWEAVPVFYLYAVLAFSEVAVLFASAIGLSVFVVREVIREIDHLLDVANSCLWLDPQRHSTTRHHRRYEVVGGHNERF